ncbi:MAG: alpha/beta hydrolase [Halioglobus sp.]|nr:alpha/beta hydrolase [Halioglobus sp.]
MPIHLKLDSFLMLWTAIFLLALVMAVAFTRFYLSGPSLSGFDTPLGEQFKGQEPNDEHDQVVASLTIAASPTAKASRKQQLALMRQRMDQLSDGIDFASSFTHVTAGDVPAEWVIAPGADSSRRLLYIHGGAFVMGSPRSHRVITSRFSEISGCAVLAIDYRLMPEHRRMAGVTDCQTAFEWLLKNGPDGVSPAQRIYIAGDSAGGNLALMMAAWARDHGTQKADAVVALSPVTDATFSGPSMKANVETDAMLGPMFKGLTKIPRPLLLWGGWVQNRVKPSSPVISPVFGNLQNLPPTLVHASEAEMLLDDSRRYVNRAVANGSVATLQTWPRVVHVWHMFYPQLTEAREAWDEIGKFLAEAG